MSNTVKMKHRDISIPKLTPSDRILEAARQLDHVIKQQPKQAPIEEITAIELLMKVLLGENTHPLPPNSIQIAKAKQQSMPTPEPQQIGEQSPNESSPTPNYMSDDDEESVAPTVRRSKRIQQSSQPADQDLHHIAILAETDHTPAPQLKVNQCKFARGYAAANHNSQLEEWAYKLYFAGAIVDDETGKSLEHRGLIKRPHLKERWMTSLANEIGRLAQEIRDIKADGKI